jgi:hypothetical protein
MFSAKINGQRTFALNDMLLGVWCTQVTEFFPFPRQSDAAELSVGKD